MEVIGKLGLAAAPHGGVLQAAALPDGDFHVPDAALLDVDPYYGLPYDDDLEAAYLASLPEDPFPEALFADRPFDGDASAVRTPGLGLDDRVGAATFLLQADLTADGPGLISQIRAGENIKAMIAGQQARLAVELEARQRQEQAELRETSPGTLSAEDLGKKRPKENTTGVAEQIALARGESPNRGHRLLGMAKALVTEMPHALTALDTGQLNEERAMYLVKETACLSVEDRTAVDGAGLCEACNHTKELPGWKAQPRPGPRHTLEITTPTGHSYHSTAPPLPGSSLRTGAAR
jgi:hypothetical protein